MSCLDETTLALFVDGKRTPEIEQHLDSCPTCRKLVGELARGREVALSQAATVPSVAGDRPAVGDRIDRFVLLGVSGSGAMGTVYAAYDPVLDRKVALKVLHANATTGEGRARLLREAQALARVSSPNVVAIHDVGVTDDRIYIAMELVAGGTLRTWLAEAPRSWHETVRVLEAAGRGLAAAHAAGLVHRDVKPDNVLIDGDRIRVADFGLAAAASRGEAPETSALDDVVTRTGVAVGTPAYMAPEQLSGEHVDAKSDQFSFCVTLYEALYGERPFAATTLDELRRAIAEGTLRPPSRAVPAWLRAIVVRGLAVDPAQRHPSIDALLGAIARRRRKRAVAIGASAALAIAAVSATATAALARDSSDPCAAAGAIEDVDRAAIEHGLAGAGASPSVIAQTLARLATWRSEAGATLSTACRASRVDGTESVELFDLRSECVRDSVRRVSAVAATLARPTRQLARDPSNAVEQAIDLAPCKSRRAVLEPLRAPSDPVAKSQFDALRSRLATASALGEAGRLGDAIDSALAIAAAAQQAGFRAIEADAWDVVGRMRWHNQLPRDARDAFEKAILASEAIGYDQRRAKSYLELFGALTTLDRNDDAARVLGQARALIERLDDPYLRWQELYAEGANACGNGDWATCADRYRTALDAHGPEQDQHMANLYYSLAGANFALGKLPVARDFIDKAIALQSKLSGADSPALIDLLELESDIAARGGDHTGEVAILRHAMELAHAPGRGATPVVRTAQKLAVALHGIERDQEALAIVDEALPEAAETYGKDSTMYGALVQARAKALQGLHRLDEAFAAATEAVAITRAKAPDTPDVGDTLITLAEIEHDQGKLDQAVATMREARKLDPTPHPELDTSIGVMLYDAHHYTEALPVLEAALRDATGSDFDPTDRADAEVGIAKTLRALHRDPARATALLHEARTIYAAAGSTPYIREQIALIDRLLR